MFIQLYISTHHLSIAPSRPFVLPLLTYMHKDTCTITTSGFLSKNQTYIVAHAWPYHKSFGTRKAGVRAAGG